MSEQDIWMPARNSGSENRVSRVAVSATEVLRQERLTNALDRAAVSGYKFFGGSGTTLIAAEKAGRRALVVERMPAYCDQIIKRWEMMTQEKAKTLSRAVVDCDIV